MPMRFVALLLVVVSALLTQLPAQENPTLSAVLQEHSIPFPPTSIPYLNAKITSFAVLDDDSEFVIAYYLDNPKNELRAPLLLTRYNKIAGKWDHIAYSESQLKVSDITDNTGIACLGSVLSVQKSATWYFLTLHWNPSAGCMIVLKSDLTTEDARTGGVSATFESGLAIVYGNMVHFADVHPQTLLLYDPVTHQASQLYPPQHDPFRVDFSSRLEKAIVSDRCRVNNWGCQSNQFTTDLSYPLAISDATNAIAFRASFEPEGFIDREEAEASGKWYDDDYAYVFQLKPFRWREFSIYDLKPKFGTDSLQTLISPEMIEKVFATPAPNQVIP